MTIIGFSYLCIFEILWIKQAQEGKGWLTNDFNIDERQTWQQWWGVTRYHRDIKEILNWYVEATDRQHRRQQDDWYEEEKGDMMTDEAEEKEGVSSQATTTAWHLHCPSFWWHIWFARFEKCRNNNKHRNLMSWHVQSHWKQRNGHYLWGCRLRLTFPFSLLPHSRLRVHCPRPAPLPSSSSGSSTAGN